MVKKSKGEFTKEVKFCEKIKKENKIITSIIPEAYIRLTPYKTIQQLNEQTTVHFGIE